MAAPRIKVLRNLGVADIPVVGDVLDYLLNPVDFFLDRSATQGPVHPLKFGKEEITVIPSSVGAELFTPADQCPFSRKGMFAPFASEAGVDVFGSEGDTHHLLRTLLRLGYSRQVTAEFLEPMLAVTRTMVAAKPRDRAFPFQRFAEEVALLCVAKSLTPVDLGHLSPSVLRLGGDVMYATTKLLPERILRLPGYQAARNQTRRAVSAAIERHLAGGFRDHREMYMIDAFIAARGPGGEQMGPRELLGAAMYALAGSQLYLGRTITFAIYHLLKNRTLLDAAQVEVDTVLAKGKSLSTAMISRMPTLRACYREVLRMYPLVSGMPFMVSRDFSVRGKEVKKDSMVLVSSVADHYDPEVFPDPQTFQIGRSVSAAGGDAGKKMTPFGVGGRVCAAAGMAELVTITALSAILHEARWRLTSPAYRIRLALKPLLCPADGLMLKMERLRTDADRFVDESAVSIDKATDPYVVESSKTLADLRIEPVKIPAGQDVVREGEAPDFFYIIVKGTVSVWQDQGEGKEAEKVAALDRGSSFGEAGLLKNAARNATVRAETDLVLLRIAGDVFQTLVAESDLVGRELCELLLKRFTRKAVSEALPRLEKKVANDTLGDFDFDVFDAGETILRQGEPAEDFYIVVSGSAEVVVTDRSGVERKVGALAAGDQFGEIGILERRPRTATVRAGAEGPVTVLHLARAKFEALLKSSTTAGSDLAQIAKQRLLDLLDTLR